MICSHPAILSEKTIPKEAVAFVALFLEIAPSPMPAPTAAADATVAAAVCACAVAIAAAPIGAASGEVPVLAVDFAEAFVACVANTLPVSVALMTAVVMAAVVATCFRPLISVQPVCLQVVVVEGLCLTPHVHQERRLSKCEMDLEHFCYCVVLCSQAAVRTDFVVGLVVRGDLDDSPYLNVSRVDVNVDSTRQYLVQSCNHANVPWAYSLKIVRVQRKQIDVPRFAQWLSEAPSVAPFEPA